MKLNSTYALNLLVIMLGHCFVPFTVNNPYPLCIFRKWEGVVGTGWSWLRIETGGGHL